MGRQGSDKMQGIESLGQDFIKSQQDLRIIPAEKSIHQRETIFIIKDIKVPKDILILHIGTTESHRLVEDCQSIPHRSVSLMSNHVKGFVIN